MKAIIPGLNKRASQCIAQETTLLALHQRAHALFAIVIHRWKQLRLVFRGIKNVSLHISSTRAADSILIVQA